MKLVVIANLKVGLSSLRAFQESRDCEISLVIAHPDLTGIGSLTQRFCEEHGIEYLESKAPNSEPVLERLREIAPDYLFSIYNPNILKPAILGIPKAAINFHAAPLPRYRGTNTFSWAIINGDHDYGVAWHIMEPTIDTGDMRSLPFADGSFDLVVSSLAIHNIRGRLDRAKAVAEAWRVLKPGGRLLIADIRSTALYAKTLETLGAVTTTRRLGWRFWYGNPFAATSLVTASKPSPRG